MASPRPITLTVWLAAILAVWAVAGCASGGERLLSELRLSSAVIVPNGVGDAQSITVGYTLSRPAAVTAYVGSGSSEKLYLERDERRPVAGQYVLAFRGVYAPDPNGLERRVLPSGGYRLVIGARDASGVLQQSAAQIEVRDADTSLPAVERLMVSPETISPNSDGIDDAAGISYRTTKEATVTLYVVSESGRRYLLERAEHQPPGEHAITWDGQIGLRLLPSGRYRLVVEARDVAGNVAVAERSFKIDSASYPDARLLSVSFLPQRLELGGVVTVEMRVKNTGNTVLRTHGPNPGYTYGSYETFGTIEGGSFRDRKGYWRVGVDWTTAPDDEGARYPYRWGFGKDLQPGEEATVVGQIRIDHRYPQIWLHAGLIEEQVRYWDGEVGRTVVEIGY